MTRQGGVTAVALAVLVVCLALVTSVGAAGTAALPDNNTTDSTSGTLDGTTDSVDDTTDNTTDSTTDETTNTTDSVDDTTNQTTDTSTDTVENTSTDTATNTTDTTDTSTDTATNTTDTTDTTTNTVTNTTDTTETVTNTTDTTETVTNTTDTTETVTNTTDTTETVTNTTTETVETATDSVDATATASTTVAVGDETVTGTATGTLDDGLSLTGTTATNGTVNSSLNGSVTADGDGVTADGSVDANGSLGGDGSLATGGAVDSTLGDEGGSHSAATGEGAGVSDGGATGPSDAPTDGPVSVAGTAVDAGAVGGVITDDRAVEAGSGSDDAPLLSLPGLPGYTALPTDGLAAGGAGLAGVAVVAGGAAATRGSATLYRLRDALGEFDPIAVLLRYSRYDDSDPLEHEDRATVYEVVEDAPGVYLSALSESTDVPLSTVRHHVRILEEENVVTSAKIDGKRRYFPVATSDVALHAALANPSRAAVLETLAERGAAHNGLVADELDLDPSTVSHHLDRLADDGLVERERDGRSVVNSLTPTAEAGLEGTRPVAGTADD
ncbi:winged helix-turn-helix transcriptional regulator [Haloarchaeobius baliensis]|uniref:winged helix-turn-helix transcriptional regulator n=1 Tax=Haloarchaeobius baliensis TaxID=1670458 RepID=UPI003F883BB8